MSDVADPGLGLSEGEMSPGVEEFERRPRKERRLSVCSIFVESWTTAEMSRLN